MDSQLQPTKNPIVIYKANDPLQLKDLTDTVRRKAIEFFLNNTNLTFLAVLYKIDMKGFQNQQK